MLMKEHDKNKRNQVHVFKDIYFKSSQIHQLTIIYCLEHTNHDILLKFLFQTLFFCVRVICINDIFHI